MNEHIEHYLKQHYCRDYFNCYGETVDDDHYFMYRDEIDGLIELVVRECAGVADNTIIGTDKVGKAIKEHFGVQ